jgi:hypothetical protein
MKFVPFRNSLFTPSAGGGMYVHDYGYDPVSDWILSSQIIYEHYVLMMMISSILASSASLVDLGCHVGTYGYAAKLLDPNIPILSIDANQKNIELCKFNSINRSSHEFVCGFWKSDSIHDHVYIQNPENAGHNELYDGLSNLRQSQDQVVVQTISNKLIIDFMARFNNISRKHHFIKVDVDGGEVGNITDLLGLIKANNLSTYILLETADFPTFNQIKNLGFIPLALLPGNNFLFCSSDLLQTMSTAIFLTTAVSYLNLVLDDQQFMSAIGMQGSFRDQKSFSINTKYGISHLSGRILNEYWQ